MPLPLLAHQAPVLPLKLRWPATWNGTALVLGSISPDLEYLRMHGSEQDRTGLAHTLLGQFVFCLPVTVSLVALVGFLRLGEVLVARLGSRFRWLASAATDVSRPGGFRRAGVSALAGSFSHIGFDELTHRVIPPWLPARTYHLAGLQWSQRTMVQLAASAASAAVSVWLLHTIARRTAHEAPPARPGRVLLAVLALAGAVGGVVLSLPAIREPDSYFDAGRFYVWGQVAFFMVCGVGAGTLLAGVLLAASDRRQAP